VQNICDAMQRFRLAGPTHELTGDTWKAYASVAASLMRVPL
jgi:hypothetical protein